ncbi:MAG: hypothetical protein HY925_10070 [Elusimicrobia bacterium]|nr:hypothetical protein [Elusimicrobiota bacterium]
MPPGLILAAVLASAARANVPVEGFWHETLSPHFEIRHEAGFLPPGFVIGLEKIHNRLRMDLSMFSPWMAKERVKLAFYADRKSYLGGEYKPPAWSNGIAFHKEKTVAVYDQPNRKKLLEIISHETTHLFFEGYWWESGKGPPQWLNEGLAMMEETEDPAVPEKSEWFQTMALLDPEKTIPFEKFVEVKPTQDLNREQDKDAVSLWYVQAFSVVHFLYREHSRQQFRNFCNLLREGKPLEAAVWTAYRYAGVPELDRSWKAWLRKPTTIARMRRYLKTSAEYAREEAADAAAAGSAPSGRIGPGGMLKQLKPSSGLKDFEFNSLQSK